MPSSNVEVIEIGIPGPPGAGITPAEKAGLMPKTGGTFTGAAKTTPSVDGSLVLYEKADGTDLIVLDTANGILKFLNGLDLAIYSDGGSTLKAAIDAGTGNLDIEGSIDFQSAAKGEELWLSFRAYEGGSVLTTGIKDFVKLPYDCEIVSDGSKAWEVGADPSGSISWDLWVSSTWPATSANRISGSVGSQNPRVSSAASASSADLTGWTTTLSKGHWLFASIAGSPATATRSAVGLHIQKR